MPTIDLDRKQYYDLLMFLTYCQRYHPHYSRTAGELYYSLSALQPSLFPFATGQTVRDETDGNTKQILSNK